MKKNYIPTAIVFCVIALQATSASATVITRGFNLDFTSGQLDGQNFMGTLSYDDVNLSGAGDETLGPTGGTLFPEGALSFDVTILGVPFAIGDDRRAPDFPAFLFSNGALTRVDGTFEPNGPDDPPRLTIGAPLAIHGDDGGFSQGVFSLKPLQANVPGPATLTLFGLGLLGVGVARRRQSTQVPHRGDRS
jgi:hypothetical protein